MDDLEWIYSKRAQILAEDPDNAARLARNRKRRFLEILAISILLLALAAAVYLLPPLPGLIVAGLLLAAIQLVGHWTDKKMESCRCMVFPDQPWSRR